MSTARVDAATVARAVITARAAVRQIMPFTAHPGTGELDLDTACAAVQLLATQPQSPPLQAGEIVTTGTLTAAHRVSPGENWRTTLQGIALPGLAMTFA